jgi:cobalt-zinc-cadmium efflux system outer membrane protein
VHAAQTSIPLPTGGTERETELGLTQTLPYPGNKRAQRRAATYTSEAAQFSYQEAQAQAFHELRTRYLSVAAAEARVQALQQLTDAVAEAAHTADVRHEEGDFSPFGRARMRVAVADFENALADAQVSRRNARLRLAAYILPDSTMQAAAPETLITYTVAAPLQAPAFDAAYDALRTQALAQRGLLNAAEAQVDAQQQRAQAQQADAKRAVEVELRTAYTEAQSYRNRIDQLSGEVLASTDSLLQQAQYVYEEGELNLVGLLDAMEAARSAQLLQIDLVAGYLHRLAALEYAMGVRPTDTPPLLPADRLAPAD